MNRKPISLLFLAIFVIVAGNISCPASAQSGGAAANQGLRRELPSGARLICGTELI